jgi:hypothetical protein
VPADQIFNQLEELQASKNLHALAAVKRGYLALCERAANEEDRKMFRLASERALLAAGRDSWQIQNQLDVLRLALDDELTGDTEHSDMPHSPKVEQLTVQP